MRRGAVVAGRVFAGIVAFVVGLAVVAGIVYRAASLPKVDGPVTLATLSAPVDVVRDSEGIPHVYATRDDDAWFALGYVHAQDRLWQMELNRRTAAGRLAEILGPGALDIDRFLRTIGVARNAAAIVANLDEATRRALVRYAAGVNANLAERRAKSRLLLPPEFVLTGAPFPDDWTPADSIGWTTMMAWDLSTNWTTELQRMRLSERLTKTQIDELMPSNADESPLAVADYPALYRSLAGSPKAAARTTRPVEHSGLASDIAAAFAPDAGVARDAIGSNDWVVSGARTTSGKPLLANDPHLALSAPSIWYLAHLSGPTLDVIGATLPGIPFVVIGHNRRIGWGVTNTGPDTQDLFLEELRTTATGVEARTPDGWEPLAVRDETIRVKGGADVRLVVRESRHGPLVSDVSTAAIDALRRFPAGRYGIAFRWAALRPDDRTMQAGIALDRAHDWPSFVAALRDFHAPQQNFVYGDVDGTIGFIAPGRVPVRKPANDLMGQVPAPGWDARYDWDGFVPFDDLPQRVDPPEGRLVTANDKVVLRDRPFLTSEWAPPFRASRIAALLDATPKHDVASFARIQSDVGSLATKRLLPLLVSTIEASADAGAVDLAPIVAQLAAWDGSMDADAAEPLIYAAWMRELSRLIPRDELGDTLFAATWEQRTVFIANVLADRDGQSRWCDDVGTPVVETCDQIKTRALRLAIADLSRRLGPDRSGWRWKALHVDRSEHRPFSGVPLLGRLFGLTAHVGGDSNTVNVSGYSIRNEADPYVGRHGPSLREIVDFGDLERSRFITSTGQSGHRLSPDYARFVERWSRVESVPMRTDRATVERDAEGTLRLAPR